MINRIFTCLAFIVFSSQMVAARYGKEPVPMAVNIDTVSDNAFPPIYYTAINYYRFVTRKEIVSLQMDATHFEVSMPDLNLFRISHLEQPNSGKCGLRTRLTFTFADKSTRSFNVRIIPFPPVRILFQGVNMPAIDATSATVHWSGTVTCKSVWDFPPYAVATDRVFGHFLVSWYSGGQLLGVSDGWGDTGDRSREFVIPAHTGTHGVTAVIDQHISIGRHPSDIDVGGFYDARLSPDEPSIIKFISE